MGITDRNTNTVGPNKLEAIAERWRVSSSGFRRVLAGIRDPHLRAEIQRLIDAHWTGQAPERSPAADERSQALAAICEALLRQFDDEQAGAAEIRLVVHKRDELPSEPAANPGPDARWTDDADEAELVLELRQLLVSSSDAIADVTLALERRGDDVDGKGRELLQDELRAVAVEIAVLRTVLSDPVDWDGEYKRLLSDEVQPFEHPADHDADDDDSGE